MSVYKIPNTEFEVVPEAVECPHCDTTIMPALLHAVKIDNFPHHNIVAFVSCIEPSCKRPFLIEFKKQYKSKDTKWESKPFTQQWIYDFKYEASLPDKIESLQDNEKRPYLENFFEIYQEAYTANEHGLEKVAGTGLRKSLEFLIKDYAMYFFQDKKDRIPEMTLKHVINLFQDNKPLNAVAERATWLGNDQTHYYIQWTDKDIEDLMELIESTLFWIVQTESYHELLVSMPDPKKSRNKSS